MMQEGLFKYYNFCDIEKDEDFKKIPFDLQLFAAEDEGRTEEPTEKKIREAREKGQVAKTQELSQSLVVISGFLIVFFLGKWIYNELAKLITFYLSNFSSFSLTKKTLFKEGSRIFEVHAKVLLPIFVTVFIAAFIAEIVQVGFKISSHPLKLDFSKIKLNPSEMLKKILFSKQVAMNLFKSIFKILVVGVCSYIIISNDFHKVLRTPDVSVAAAFTDILYIALKILIWAAVLLLILAIPDYIFQRKELMESLKMSKQEMKDELKESNGDPHMKSRLREMQRELLTRNMIREVPKADVIITNPTHFAVALKYSRDVADAPVVIAKGVDSIALKIREIAKNNGIMRVENRPLAQELYYNVDIGDIIPEELFKAVSEVYTLLYKAGKFQQAI
jgi:flagellar biosynthetic protein FlhB